MGRGDYCNEWNFCDYLAWEACEFPGEEEQEEQRETENEPHNYYVIVNGVVKWYSY